MEGGVIVKNKDLGDIGFDLGLTFPISQAKLSSTISLVVVYMFNDVHGLSLISIGFCNDLYS